MDFEETDYFSEDEISDEDFILQWTSCKLDPQDENYEECENCKFKQECLDFAIDNCDGYSAFCDCIVGCGYDSMDDFWECNGI